MRNLAVVCMCGWASGCGALQALGRHEESAKPMELPPTAQAGWVDGSLCIGCDSRDDPPALRMIYWDKDLDDAKRAQAVAWKLTGPGVEKWVSPEFIPWQEDWPAGGYKLAVVALGKVLAEREFRVAWIPTGRGHREAMVVPDAPHVIAHWGRDELVTYVPMNVTRPLARMQAVWVQDHRVVHYQDKWVSIHDLLQMSSLARLVEHKIDTFKLKEPATLFLFVDGAQLYGAWSWTGKEEDEAHPVSLPDAAPDPKDLARARATARESYADGPHRDPLGGPTDETLACALATSEEARDAFGDYQRRRFANGSLDRQVSDDLNRANNDARLTERQRTELRQHARWDAQANGEAVRHQGEPLAAAMRFARKFKKGCLAELGVPGLPAMQTR